MDNALRHPLARGGTQDLRNNAILNWHLTGIQCNAGDSRT